MLPGLLWMGALFMACVKVFPLLLISILKYLEPSTNDRVDFTRPSGDAYLLRRASSNIWAYNIGSILRAQISTRIQTILPRPASQSAMRTIRTLCSRRWEIRKKRPVSTRAGPDIANDTFSYNKALGRKPRQLWVV
ncbi:hypothetical protein L211DRAFT_853952 [Terfezia boudieri ATCC MYA-4762]|uniref:Uncharacterized protein n=1 Tax=Terfezia boudieri ATCC MYA-4762 TaxID=1051890 RepID=A0A3N4LL02_9PEZI|nr:hypothetical protein L211DRAFT_853952 [Terfezia boudieri ATCC MYA-4762]